MSEPCPDEFVEFGEILAETAAGPIRHYFQNPDAAPVEIKPDGSCYSLADKKGEVVMREAIRALSRPRHRRRGIPARERRGRVRLGARPGRWHQRLRHRKLYVHDRDRAAPEKHTHARYHQQPDPGLALADALLCCASPAYIRPADHDAFFEFTRAVGIVGYGSYTHAGGFVAQGLIDLHVESTVSPHDYLAHLPIIEGAGGIVTNWEGCALGGYPVERLLAAGDARLHELAVA